MKIAIAQFETSDTVPANLLSLAEMVEAAAEAGAELLIAPEGAMRMPSSLSEVGAIAEPLDGPFLSAVSRLAGEHHVAIVVGVWERAGSNVFNTLVAVDATGDLCAAYRKVHLYDAFNYAESDHITPSQDLTPVVFSLGGVTFGLATCYDVRFPEIARLLVDAGADVIVLPSGWVPGPLKEDHWITLLRARAIENTVYVVASNQAPPVGTGRSLACDPNGVVEVDLGARRGSAVVDIDLTRIEATRRTNPSLKNRRFTIIPGDDATTM